MAESPAHKFGQIIGGLLESVVQPPLAQFCERQGLYLDYQANKRSVRRGRKVRWEDPYGNLHDLDFVIEREGSNHKIGQPVAFIEVAWRRYTKHSRNKAQEIQGAILPLAERYKWNNPFQRIKKHLVEANSRQITDFFMTLDSRLGRSIRRIHIIPLYGRLNEFVSIESALKFLDAHPIYEGSGVFQKYEILVEFSNGDKVDAFFSTKQKVRDFLNYIATQ